MKGLVRLCIPSEALLRAGLPEATVVSRETLDGLLATTRGKASKGDLERRARLQEIHRYFQASGRSVLPVLTPGASLHLQDRFKDDDALLIRALGQRVAIYELDYAECLAAKAHLRKDRSLAQLLDLYQRAESADAFMAQAAIAEAVWARALSPAISDADRAEIPRALEVRRAISPHILRRWIESARQGHSLQHLEPLIPALIGLAKAERGTDVLACIAAIGGPEARRFLVESLEKSQGIGARPGELDVLLPSAAAAYVETRDPSILAKLEQIIAQVVRPARSSLFGDEERQHSIRPVLTALAQIAARGDDEDRANVRQHLDTLALGATVVLPEPSRHAGADGARAAEAQSYSYDVAGLPMRWEVLSNLQNAARLLDAYAQAENPAKALAVATHIIERSFSEEPHTAPLTHALRYVRVAHGQDALPPLLRDRLRDRMPREYGRVPRDDADALLREVALWREVERAPLQDYVCGARDRVVRSDGAEGDPPAAP